MRTGQDCPGAGGSGDGLCGGRWITDRVVLGPVGQGPDCAGAGRSRASGSGAGLCGGWWVRGRIVRGPGKGWSRVPKTVAFPTASGGGLGLRVL